MIIAFELAVVFKIKKRMKEFNEDSIFWSKFVEYLKNNFSEEELERMNKKSFLE